MNPRLAGIAKSALYFIGSLNANKNKSRMVYYHDVHSTHMYTDMSTSLSDFDRHMSIIGNLGFKIVRSFSGSDKEIRVAFDDGFRGVWDNRDYFVKNSIPATIFIATSLIGKPGYLS